MFENMKVLLNKNVKCWKDRNTLSWPKELYKKNPLFWPNVARYKSWLIDMLNTWLTVIKTITYILNMKHLNILKQINSFPSYQQIFLYFSLTFQKISLTLKHLILTEVTCPPHLIFREHQLFVCDWFLQFQLCFYLC